MNRVCRVAWVGGIVALQNQSAHARTDPLTNISFSETLELPGNKQFALHGVKPHSMKASSIFGIFNPKVMWWKMKVKMQREPLYCAAMYNIKNATDEQKANFVFRIQAVDELNAEDLGHLFFEKMNVWLKYQIGSELNGLRGGELFINALNLTLRQGDELIFEFLPEGAFNIFIDSGTGPCIAAKVTSPVITKALQSCFFGRVIDFWHERTKDL